MDKYVEIVNEETSEVVRRMGPMDERRAERVQDGANINLNHDKFFTRIVDEEEAVVEQEKAKPPHPGFCSHPDRCAGLSSCPRDPTCID